MGSMPMFPLSSVLFPAMPLTLRIFEERYLRLLGDLMSSDNPEFGVVLSTRSADTESDVEFVSIGTVAAVTEIGTTGEFLGLESHGSTRFRVLEWLPDDPYPIADVEIVPDLTWSDSFMSVQRQVEERVRRVLALASEFGELLFGPMTELSDDPVEACWQLAGILPVGELDRFDLLSSTSIGDLLTQTGRIAEAAEIALREMLGRPNDGSTDAPPFT